MRPFHMSGTILILIRHGERVRWSGQTQKNANEAPLTRRGQCQALRVAQVLQEVPLVAIYSSPYRRCIQTATIISARGMHTIPLVLEPNLREWDILPSYYAHPVREAWKYACRATPSLRPPEGESIQDLARRGATICERIANDHQGRIVAICGHGALFRAACQQLVWAPQLIEEELKLLEGHMLWLWREQENEPWIVLPPPTLLPRTGMRWP